MPLPWKASTSTYYRGQDSEYGKIERTVVTSPFCQSVSDYYLKYIPGNVFRFFVLPKISLVIPSTNGK